MLMIYVGGFVSNASQGQTFQGPLAKQGLHRLDYYRSLVVLP